jgi:F-type H+-transporting ATPase subunit delta
VRSSIIARNYAETLIALAKRHGGDPTVDEYGAALDEVIELLRSEPRVRQFLETPVVDAERKKDALGKTLRGRVPELFLRFLMVVVEKRRASQLEAIAEEYLAMVDEMRGRVRARVLVAREPDAALRTDVVQTLERMLGRTVIATFQVDRSLIGGAVIRVGDQILDGSVRSRATALRRRLLAAQLPSLAGV